MAVTRFAPSWSTLLAGAAVSSLTSTRLGASPRLKSLRTIKRIVALLLFLTWRSLPFVWHVDLFGLIPLIRLRIWLRGVEKVLAIAKNPFDTKVTTKGFVGFDAADWNGHMSNSSYPRALDSARFKWLIEVVGPAMGVEKIWSPLAQTAFWFKSEIPAFAAYEIDVHVTAWDDKWIYYTARFTTAPKKGSKERTLNCVALSRSCFKLQGSRLSIPPARVLSLSGVGPDRSNWERTLALRKARKGRAWLKYGGEKVAHLAGKLPAGAEFKEVQEWEDDGMSVYEERRLAGLAVVERFGDVSGWEEL
uniref:Thioesterase domain-containing protein n=1 Tax=Leucosporidium scottii TaxID=5278 RepID=A0A0H5FRU8_9BASI|nr:hypothetical protein ls5930a1_00106 [Leucosporidium scottii]